MPNKALFQETHNTPFGWITVFASNKGVTFIDWNIDGKDDNTNANDVSRETWKQINQYCTGKRQSFDLPLDPDASPALREWLNVLQKVPFGDTITYKEFAIKAGHSAKSSRAAGSACANNPIPLIIPCHRITRHDGSLGNFGAIRHLDPQDPRNLAIKQALIDHEAQNAMNSSL